MDSANYVTLMLMDKGYYDYDYHDFGDTLRAQQNAPKNDEELKAMLDNMGIQKASPSADALQKMAMESLGENPEATASIPRGTIINE